jgi:hypothetical protein
MVSGQGRGLALLVLCLVIVGWVGLALALQWCRERRCGQRRRGWRTLRPRPTDDCPACAAHRPAVSPSPAAAPLVSPWRAGRSRRGRPRQVLTAGHACPEPTCP